MATGQDIPKDMWAELDKYPLVAPPPGIIPDPVNRVPHRLPVTISAAICIPMVLILAGVRVYTKRVIVRKWGFDDYVFIVSVAAGISLICLNVALIHGGGYGFHAWDVTIGDLTRAVLERSIAMMVLQGPVTWLVKCALFSLILTAFKPIIWLRNLCWLGIVVTGMFYTYCAIYSGVTCGPKGGLDRAAYLAGMAGTKCHDPAGYIQINNILMGAFGVFSDFYLLIIPLPAILKLHLPSKRKLGVLGIFLAGLGACSMSIVALKFRIGIYKTQDNNYDLVALLTVIAIELSVGMMIPAFASFVTFVRHFSGRIRGHLDSKYGSPAMPLEHSEGTNEKTEDESGLAKYRKILLPNGKTYSQSDTIDKMVFGKNGQGFGLETIQSNGGRSSYDRSDRFTEGGSTDKIV